MYTQEENEAWLEKFFEALDSFDTSRLANVLTKDAVVRAGNEPEIKGLETIQQHFTGMFSLFESQKHKNLRVDSASDGHAIYNTVEISMVFKSDPENPLVLPALAYFVRVPPGEEEAGKCKTLTIYEDLGPFKAKIRGGL